MQDSPKDVWSIPYVSVAFSPGLKHKWHFYEDNTPDHNSILVTYYLTKMGIKTVPHPPYITTWTLTKRLERKLDGNYTRMLRAVLNKSWRQHPTRLQLYGHLPPITKTIQVRRTRHAGHCWRSKDELISDVLLWTPTYGCAKVGRPARTYIQQLCEDTGCNPEDLPEAMNDREKWRERVRDIRAGGATWWWWKHNFIAYRSSKVSSRPDCIFEIHQPSQSGFSRLYSNCCCSCSFEPEIIKIGQSSYKMYSNSILNFQESTTNLNACTKKGWKLIEYTTYIGHDGKRRFNFRSILRKVV